MSKAFTKESDDEVSEPVVPRVAAALPPGAKNYLTPAGEKSFREELSRLRAQPEPTRAVEQRIVDLQQSLATAEVLPPPPGPADRVAFGATVTVRERGADELTYRIVGVDEVDFDRGWVSWVSPIARALLRAGLGEEVRFKAPSGERVLEIVGIFYE